MTLRDSYREIESRWGCHVACPFRLALRPTQLHVRWVSPLSRV